MRIQIGTVHGRFRAWMRRFQGKEDVQGGALSPRGVPASDQTAQRGDQPANLLVLIAMRVGCAIGQAGDDSRRRILDFNDQIAQICLGTTRSCRHLAALL
jgi:hypothetical protein